MGYTRKTIKGLSWMGSFRMVTRVISFVRTAVIARLLTPTQFGLYGIALLILSLIEILTETGINIFLTQRHEDIDEYINTSWLVSILRGFLIAIVILAFSKPIVWFFNAPGAWYLLLLVSIVPILRGFINPSIVKFLKDLQYHKEFYYRTFIFTVESVVTLVVVYLYRTPAGIVWGLIAGAGCEVVLSFIFAGPRPHLEFKRELFLSVVHSGKWMTASGVFNYLYHNADNIFVGRILGVSPLGLYDMAYRLSMLPITEVSDLVTRVTFPIFVKISGDKERVRRAYFKTTVLTSVCAIGIGGILFLFPGPIISVVLGNNWISAKGVLRVLALFGIVRSISFSSISVFYAFEKQKIVTFITLVSVVGMLITVGPFIVMFGLIGAGYSALFGSMIALPVIGHYLKKELY